jgi:hypothetical protein
VRSKVPGKSRRDSSARVEIPLSADSIEYLKPRRRTEVFMVIPLTQTYMEVLEQIQSSFRASQGETPQSSSFIPFLVTCAAALECLLNDNLIMHSDYIFGLDPKNKFAKAFLSMSLRGKLDTIIPLLTSNKYVIRQVSPTYQKLCRLIKLRNELMHGKAFATKHDVTVEHRESDGIGFSPIKLPKMPYHGIGIEDCDGFLRALREMDSLLSSIKTLGREESPPAEYQGLLTRLPPR